MEVYEYPGYRCGPCPPGLQGNGTHCTDINEVGRRGLEDAAGGGGLAGAPRGGGAAGLKQGNLGFRRGWRPARTCEEGGRQSPGDGDKDRRRGSGRGSWRWPG